MLLKVWVRRKTNQNKINIYINSHSMVSQTSKPFFVASIKSTKKDVLACWTPRHHRSPPKHALEWQFPFSLWKKITNIWHKMAQYSGSWLNLIKMLRVNTPGFFSDLAVDMVSGQLTFDISDLKSQCSCWKTLESLGNSRFIFRTLQVAHQNPSQNPPEISY